MIFTYEPRNGPEGGTVKYKSKILTKEPEK